MYVIHYYVAMTREEKFNTISHFVGAVFALAGAVVLIVMAANDGGLRKIVSFTVYGSALFSLYLVSTLYHGLDGKAKFIFRILDHQAIYLLIAGTYTPFALVTLRNDGIGWWLFMAIWVMAIVGIALDITLEAVLPRNKRIVPVVIYLLMGWLIVFALDPLLATLPAEGFYWLLVGGIFYTVGVSFFILNHWYGWAHNVWHLFVMAGSACHYISIAFYV